MYSLMQVLIIIFLTGLYALIGSILTMPIMALVTYKTKDKSYFRKKIDRLIKR
jgi:hypothetical protein